MKGLVRLSDSQQASFHAAFPMLADLNNHDIGHGYEQLAISVFDHQLDEREAYLLLNDVPQTEQERRNGLLQNFISSVLRESSVITFRFRDLDTESTCLDFFGFESADDAHQYFRHTGGQRYVAVIPEFRAVCYEGFDDTNHLFFKDRRLVTRLIELAKDAGLYVW